MHRIAQLDVALFGFGVLLGAWVGATNALVATVGIVACLLLRVVHGRRSVVLALGMFVCTLSASARPTSPDLGDVLAEGAVVRASIVDGPRGTPSGQSWRIRAHRVDSVGVVFDAVLSSAEGRSAMAGDTIEVFVRCEQAVRDFAHQNISSSRMCFAREPVEVVGGPSSVGDRIRRLLTERRLAIETELHTALGQRAGVPIAMITGTRGFVTHSERRAHQRAGTAHLLSISGVHFGALATLVWGIVGRLLRRSPRLCRRFGARPPAAILVCAVMFGYLVLVGAPVSALRAFVAMAAVALSFVFGRRTHGIVALCLGASLLVLFDPAVVATTGFQLSFAATSAIVVFWYRLPSRLRHDPYCFEQADHRRLRSAACFVAMSWVATTVTLPIIVGFSGEISIASFATNLVVVPIVGFVLFPLLAGAAVLAPVTDLAHPLMRAVGDVLLHLAIGLDEFSSLPGMVLTTGTWPRWCVAASVVLVLAATATRLRSPAVVLTVVTLTLFGGASSYRTPGSWEVSFVPVGQGDCTVVRSPSGYTFMVDAGGKTSGRDPGLHIVAPYLRRAGISQLDAIVVSHPDADHLGGVPGVLTQFWDARVITEPQSLGVDSVLLRRWSSSGTRNNRSVVTRIDANGVVIVLAADVEAQAERAWLEAEPHRIDLLKVAHHGSKTSSTKAFLDAARPVFSVICAGRHNRFGHPHATVVRRLRAVGARVASTSWNGLIVVQVQADGSWHVRATR